MFKSGAFVAEHLGDVREDQVQPNGVDLTLGTVFAGEGTGRITCSGKTIADRRELTPAEPARETAGAGAGDEGAPDITGTGAGDEEAPEVFHLEPGGYVVRYGDRVAIPEGHVGFIYPRSSLLRNSCMLDTAVWDAGYEGVGEGLLEVYRPIELERGARIAQLVLADAAHEGIYEGSYQREHVE